jgi:hypothetical protein
MNYPPPSDIFDNVPAATTNALLEAFDKDR